jgi:hypothetical protein
VGHDLTRRLAKVVACFSRASVREAGHPVNCLS